MPDTQHILEQRLSSAIASAIGQDHADQDPQIRPSTNPKFGDYQANLAMGLAKKLGQNPRQLAQQIIDRLDTAGVCDRVDVAGPGFINLHLSNTFLSDQISAVANDADRFGAAPADPPQTVVVDYSGPNVAKEMHVGHLRSTLIGDCLSRVLAFQGHDVIRQNHLGDWGTQFGMLIEILHDKRDEKGDLPLNQLYQQAKRQFDEDPGFADRARKRVVSLQQGDLGSQAYWEALVGMSKQYFQQVYGRLDVGLTETDFRGESFYNPMLPGVIEGLQNRGVLQTSQGAAVVFPPGFQDREGQALPLIVRKSDGGYLYATTDLAAAQYRIARLKARRLIYVTDARQSQHFAMVFATLQQAGWGGGEAGDGSGGVKLEHVPFGTVLGKDNKPFKTRSGDTVKLIDLLDEAEKRAEQIISQKNPGLPESQRSAIAHTVGIGALKYADLSNDRIKDYVFDWDRMLAFDGNTAPYLQNAYVRIQSIFRKGDIDATGLRGETIIISEPAERALAVKVLGWPAVIEAVACHLEPHRLCTYLYELASTFHRFYEKCPVLGASDESSRNSRLALCALVAGVLEKGLGLLGIGVVEQM